MPTIALVLVLLIVGAASLNNWVSRGMVGTGGVHTEQQSKKDAFIAFGNNFFTIARRADGASKNAFTKLHALVAGVGSVKAMQSAFREAAEANRKAAVEYKTLDIPQVLSSRQKLERSLDTMSKAYTARELACETLADWNGDQKDEVTKSRYIIQTDQVQQLTENSLRDFLDAAGDNGLTQDDLRHLISAGVLNLK